MYPRIISFSKDLALTSYGLLLVTGLLVSTYFFVKDKHKPAHLTEENLIDILSLGIFSGLAGGRILWALTEPSTINFQEFFMIWQGGLCVQGALIGTLSALSCYLYLKNIPILPFFDRLALYAPLFHAISRIGCFLGGCCYGAPFNGFCSITYHNPLCNAPLDVPLHPAQLYSSAMLLCIFGLLLYIQSQRTKPGYLICFYLILGAIERFVNDMFRGDIIQALGPFSLQQMIALGIMTLAGFYGSYLISGHATKRDAL